MSDMKGFVTKDNISEKKNFEAHTVHVDEIKNNEWTDLTEEAEQSQYRAAYDNHMSLRQRLLNANQSKKLKDFRRMDMVKTAMSELTELLQKEMPEDDIRFEIALKSVTSAYAKLMRACKDYIDKTWGTSKEIRGRIRMVKELFAYAKNCRRCFSDRGSIKEIRESGEGQGLLFYNILGISLADYRSKEIGGADATKWDEIGDMYHKEFENADGGNKTEYYISKETNRISTVAKSTTSMSRLARFLGEGGLVRKTEIVAAKNSKGERLFGMKRAGYFSEENKSVTDLQQIVEDERNKSKMPVTLTYSSTAIRQMSSLKLLGILCGNDMKDAESSFTLSYSRKEVGDKIIYNVDGVYYDFMLEGFSGKYDAKKLKKNLDLSKFPGIDKEFANAILTMEPEDIGVICGDLLSKKEIAAFGERLVVLQDKLMQQQENDFKFNAGKVILSRNDWESETNGNRLNDRMRKESNVVFRNMFVVSDGIEGMEHDDKTEGEAFYEGLYYAERKKLLSAKTPEEKYEILNKLCSLSANEYYGVEGVFKTKKGTILENVFDRLMGEFISADIIGAAYHARLNAYREIESAYINWRSKIKMVPDEYVREDKRGKLSEKEQGTAKMQYAALLVFSEKPHLFHAIFGSNKYTNLYHGLENKTMKGKYNSLTPAKIKKFVAEYDLKKGMKPDAQTLVQRDKSASFGKEAYDYFAGGEGLLDKAKYDEVYNRVVAGLAKGYDEIIPEAYRVPKQQKKEQ